MILISRAGIVLSLILLLIIKIADQFFTKQVEENKLINKIFHHIVARYFIKISPIIFLSLYFISFCLMITNKAALDRLIKEKNPNDDTVRITALKKKQPRIIMFLLASILSFLLLTFFLLKCIIYLFNNRQFLDNKNILDQFIIFFNKNSEFCKKIIVFIERYEVIIALLSIAIESCIVGLLLAILIIDVFNLYCLMKSDVNIKLLNNEKIIVNSITNGEHFFEQGI